MFRSSNLKLYRKFLILAVLVGGLSFTLTAGRITSASCCGSPWPPCCSECTYGTNQCINENGCYNYPPGALRDMCIYDCFEMYYECRLTCDGLC